MSTNPYQAPAADLDDVADRSDTAQLTAELVRRDHIQHEASLKAVGLLFWLSGAMAGAAGFLQAGQPLWMAVLLLLAAGYIITGTGLRKLRSNARLPATLLATLGLLGFPVGTVVNAYILYLLHSHRGQRIFAEDYAQIIALTPHIKYKTSKIVWFFVGLLVLLVLFVAAAAVIPMLSQ